MGDGLLNPINILLIGVCVIVVIRMLMVSSCLFVSQFLFIKELDSFQKHFGKNKIAKNLFNKRSNGEN